MQCQVGHWNLRTVREAWDVQPQPQATLWRFKGMRPLRFLGPVKTSEP